MEAHFLDEFVASIKEQGDEKGCLKEKREPWYCKNGDYVEYLATDEAYVARRIDTFLTIYYSVENEHAIGFQLKGIAEMLKQLDIEGLIVSSEWKKGSMVSLSALLVMAIEEATPSISSRVAYTEAVKLKPENDLVLV